MIDAIPNRPLSTEHVEKLHTELESFAAIAWDDDGLSYSFMVQVGEDHVVTAYNDDTGGWEVVDRLDEPNPVLANDVLTDWLSENPPSVDLNIVDAEWREVDEEGSDK